MVNELIRQFYHDKGIEYAGDYYDDLVDYEAWARRKELSSNPRQGNRNSTCCSGRLHC